jgi:NADH-quinone oxidoreductase subunit N
MIQSAYIFLFKSQFLLIGVALQLAVLKIIFEEYYNKFLLNYNTNSLFVDVSVSSIINFTTRKFYNLFYNFGLGALIISLCLLINNDFIISLNKEVIDSHFIFFVKFVFILLSIFCYITSYKSIVTIKLHYLTFVIVYLIMVAAGIMMIDSLNHNFLELYTSMELFAIVLYFFIGLSSKTILGISVAESNIKFFLYNIVLSSFFLIGVLVIYSVTGTLDFTELQYLLSNSLFIKDTEIYFGCLVALFLIFLTIFYKLGLAPFQSIGPEMYEGTSITTLLMIMVLPKYVFSVILIKLIITLNTIFISNQLLIISIGLLSLIAGSIITFFQKKVRRFFIYGSTVPFSIFTILLALPYTINYTYSYFFLVSYTVLSFVLWSFFSFIYINKDLLEKFENGTALKTWDIGIHKSTYLSDFTGLFNKNRVYAVILGYLILSFSGLPPFVYFLTKISIISQFVYNNSISLALLVSILGLLMLGYYFKIIKLIFYDKSKTMQHYINTKREYFGNFNNKLDTLSLILSIVLIFSVLSIVYFDFFINEIKLCMILIENF